MKNINFKMIGKTISLFLKKNQKELEIGAGIGGLVVSAFVAGYQTPKFQSIIKKQKEENDGKLQAKEVAVAAAKCYAAPVAGLAASGTSLGLGLAAINKENAGYVAIAKAAEESVKEISSKLDEELGEEKANEIRDKVLKDRVKKADRDTEYTECRGEERWFYEKATGITFKSTINDVYAALNEANDQMNDNGYLSLAEWLDFLTVDIPLTPIIATMYGWNKEQGLLKIRSLKNGDAVVIDGRAYLVIDYYVRPDIDFEYYA